MGDRDAANQAIAMAEMRSRTEQALEKYTARCGSGFGDGSKMLSMDEVVAELRSWPEWAACISGWLASFERALAETVDPLLAQVPDSWWSPERRQLARALLQKRLERLSWDAVISVK